MRRLVVFLGLVFLFAVPVVALAQYDYPTGPSMGGGGDSSGGDVSVGGPPMGDAGSSMGGVGEVAIVDFAFQPMSASVDAGTTVQWHNEGAAPHTVTAFNGAFDSGTIGSGGNYSTIFSDPGVYTYHCTIHPNMVGTVRVTGA
jgi:plastocyanin